MMTPNRKTAEGTVWLGKYCRDADEGSLHVEGNESKPRTTGHPLNSRQSHGRGKGRVNGDAPATNTIHEAEQKTKNGPGKLRGFRSRQSSGLFGGVSAERQSGVLVHGEEKKSKAFTDRWKSVKSPQRCVSSAEFTR